MSGPPASPMETLGGRVVRIRDCLTRRLMGWSSLLGSIVREVRHPHTDQSKIILINHNVKCLEKRYIDFPDLMLLVYWTWSFGEHIKTKKRLNIPVTIQSREPFLKKKNSNNPNYWYDSRGRMLESYWINVTLNHIV